MRRKKFVLTDCNHLGATHFSTLLGRDPYFGNSWYMGTEETLELHPNYNHFATKLWKLLFLVNSEELR